MSTKKSYLALLPLSGAVAAIAVALPAPAVADPNPCIYGYTPREARPGDAVCVTYTVKARIDQENANPSQHRAPGGGAYGPDTCENGYVWREAFDGDTICVTPDERASTKADTAAAAEHLQATTKQREIEYEVYGSGGVDSIQITGRGPVHPSKLPWSGTSYVGPEVKSFEITVKGDEYATATCRIKVNGSVVDEQPVVNGTAHCVYTTP
ncbi:MAG TPA: hypothetical protein VH496_00710 [Mycobacterium sp.]|jgi:hypothetical protein